MSILSLMWSGFVDFGNTPTKDNYLLSRSPVFCFWFLLLTFYINFTFFKLFLLVGFFMVCQLMCLYSHFLTILHLYCVTVTEFNWGVLALWVKVFNATFNNITAILWWSVLLVEETGVPRENHWSATSHRQTLSNNVVLSTIWHPSFALQTNERSSRWQNLISTCAVHI